MVYDHSVTIHADRNGPAMPPVVRPDPLRPNRLREVPPRTRGTADTVALGQRSDADLVALLAASDASAASVFVERFQRRVFGLAFTILGDSRAAGVSRPGC